jgi:hypothetical protein
MKCQVFTYNKKFEARFIDDDIDLCLPAALAGWSLVYEQRLSHKQKHRHMQLVNEFVGAANQIGFFDVESLHARLNDWFI